MKKVTKEHLEQIQELNKKQIDIKIALGDTLIMQDNIDKRKAEQLKVMSEVSGEMQEFSSTLTEKYGDVQIDVISGEIIEKPSTNVEKDDNKGDS
tara:strand:- start:2149 stop:2433 length:285 start_codon:yes stop_codon:yes gene_type:complete